MRSRSFSLDDAPRDLIDAAFKVVVHWKDFQGLGTREEALELLRQQAPGANEGDRQAKLDALAVVHDRAVDAVPRHVRRRRFKLLPFSTRRDIDLSACLAELNAVAPNVPEPIKREMLGWVVHWHWER
jgi:hypothetical protein